MKDFFKKHESLAVTAGVLLALSIAAVLTLVVPRLSADVTGPPGTVPTTTLNLFNTQTLSASLNFSNTVEIAPIPSGYLAVKREILLPIGNSLAVTNVQAITNITLTGGTVLTNTYGTTGGWIPLAQTPFYDSSHVYGYCGVSNSVCVVISHIIAVPAPSPVGGNYPSGAAGYGNIGVQ